jgi:hypothetical protein
VNVTTRPNGIAFRAQAGVSLGDADVMARLMRLLVAHDELRLRHVVAGADADGRRLVLSEATIERAARAIVDGGGGRVQGQEHGETFSFEIRLLRTRLPWRRDEIAWEFPESHFRGDNRHLRAGRTLEMVAALCALVEPPWAYGHWLPDEPALADALGLPSPAWPPLLGAYWVNAIGGRWREWVGGDRLRSLPGAWHVSELTGGTWLIALYPNPLECAAPSARHAARAAAACVNMAGLRAEIEAAERTEWDAWSNREPSPEEIPLRSAIEHNARACLKLYGSRLGAAAEVGAPALAAIERQLADSPQDWRDDADTFVLLHGSLLGEVLVRRCRGRWLLGRPVEQSVVVFPDGVVEPFRLARERWAGDPATRLDAPVLARGGAS